MTHRSYLLVDDNPDFLENLMEILECAGHAVSTAPDGLEAMALIRRWRFDAIVTDLRMPGLSGIQLVRELRTVDARVPVILLSAYAADAQVREAQRNGLLAVLSKTSQLQRLLHLLSLARRGGTVVLVEHDQDLCAHLTEALRELGLTVCTAGCLEEIDTLDVKPFAALVDERVPGGPAGQSVVKVQQRFPGIPIVAIAAHARDASGHEQAFDTSVLMQRMEVLYGQVSQANS